MVRKCSRGIAEITIMEVAHQVGVRTRARALAMAAASSGSPKKRKVNTTTGKLMKLSTTSFVITSTTENLVVPAKAAESNIGRATTAKTGKVEEDDDGVVELWYSNSSPSSDGFHDDDNQVQASCCSSNGSSELGDNNDQDRTKFIDLEANDECAEAETSTYYSCRERREMTPSSNKFQEELSDDVDSTMKPTSVVDSSRKSLVGDQKMPTELELEEFFTVAEKNIQKRFQDKYNYDVVKDSPLEGRYEWIRLNP
ncbi:cyclin-dependent kinase inhibitor 7 [Cannabis sativa]|uniref:cyclin-dependent kinase inhibitor 7 n=1 Tax=Cannabis sativa TaxID=3483 RepID=UPI0029C9DC3E|nr:cyclin-dependent kinase inhibitor 7 [Cannabis sativa]